mmetsp:Transcript_114353/g.323905  ORF Transcript_114353/g.323905 Transcript_114353/m.323905 type:complete len:218 (+) Transcript_114353:430-1083(+)
MLGGNVAVFDLPETRRQEPPLLANEVRIFALRASAVLVGDTHKVNRLQCSTLVVAHDRGGALVLDAELIDDVAIFIDRAKPGVASGSEAEQTTTLCGLATPSLLHLPALLFDSFSLLPLPLFKVASLLLECLLLLCHHPLLRLGRLLLLFHSLLLLLHVLQLPCHVALLLLHGLRLLLQALVQHVLLMMNLPRLVFLPFLQAQVAGESLSRAHPAVQ